MIRLRQVRVDIKNKVDLLDIIVRKLKCNKNDIKDYKIHKKSIDARNKMLFSYVYDFDIEIDNENKYLYLSNIELVNDPVYELPPCGDTKLEYRPIVVGSGPAGLFAALILASKDYKPIIFERGKEVSERLKDIDNFWKNDILNEESNVEFGEGGAGTFSDGKLNTLVKDKVGRMEYIFKTFVECGANEDIMYDKNPHIGTDILQKVIVNLRNKILSFGGEFHYNSKVEEILIDNNQVVGIKVNNEIIKSNIVILAIGHSARDTFKHLYSLGVHMESKPLAIGVRIMHSQDLINNNQYPEYIPELPSASYKLTYNTKDGVGVYSFCMCPGGYVVNASSANNYLVINGMSNNKRDSGTANSAIVVTINDKVYGSNTFDALNYIESIENIAWSIGNGKIVAQKYIDYKNNTTGTIPNDLMIKGNYIPGNINKILPEYINNHLKEGIEYFGTKIDGFNADDVIICAPETRTSSPLRILRDENFESNIKGLYPCGEGSGYAGGITTSAIDGLKVAESIVKTYYL